MNISDATNECLQRHHMKHFLARVWNARQSWGATGRPSVGRGTSSACRTASFCSRTGCWTPARRCGPHVRDDAAQVAPGLPRLAAGGGAGGARGRHRRRDGQGALVRRAAAGRRQGRRRRRRVHPREGGDRRTRPPRPAAQDGQLWEERLLGVGGGRVRLGDAQEGGQGRHQGLPDRREHDGAAPGVLRAAQRDAVQAARPRPGVGSRSEGRRFSHQI